jgi:DNA-binding IclR family transcriptional regulator
MVKTVERAIRILNLISQRDLKLHEISSSLTIHKSTVSRLLATLEKNGLIKKDKETKRFRLGLKILDLAYCLQEGLDIRNIAHPYLAELGKLTRETIHLAVLDREEIVYLDKIESSHPVRMHSRIGNRAPLYCTAVGKVILAYLPEKELDLIMERMEFRKFTNKTIIEPNELREHLELVRKQGYSTDEGEYEPDIFCISAPIFDFNHDVVASISVSVTRGRTSFNELLQFVPTLKQFAEKISRELGYQER